jgi:hypothetical protein
MTRTHDGKEVHLNKTLVREGDTPEVRIIEQMLAALIDAEDVLFDYSMQPEYPAALMPALYKVREAIKAAEDPDRKVSVRCG